MTLVDTSIWIDHFRRGNSRLVLLLEDDMVLQHPFVFGELACGGLRNRAEILRLLANLPQAKQVTFEETIEFIETRKLFGIGLGWTDVNILASALLTGCRLWTLDKALHRTARELGLNG
jgi:hypothetical protein